MQVWKLSWDREGIFDLFALAVFFKKSEKFIGSQLNAKNKYNSRPDGAFPKNALALNYQKYILLSVHDISTLFRYVQYNSQGYFVTAKIYIILINMQDKTRSFFATRYFYTSFTLQPYS